MMLDREKAIALGASIQPLRGDRLLVLDDPSSMWFVLSGSADLFCSLAEYGYPVGTRRVLGHATTGDALFPMDKTAHGAARHLMASAVEELVLLAVPIERMPAVCSAAGIRTADVFDGWVNRLFAFLTDDIPPAVTEEITFGATMRLEAGQSVRPPPDLVAWIRVHSGNVQLVGRSALEIEPGEVSFPLGTGMWLRASESATLTAARGDDLDDHDGMIKGIRRLHGLLQSRFQELDTDEHQRELARLQKRDAVQQRHAHTALGRIASVLTRRPVIEQRDTALLSAVSLVGETLGLEIHAPPKPAALLRREEPLEAIARASRVRYRRILLRGAWWENDCGALVGYLRDVDCPVALLRSRRGVYEIVDPETRVRTTVNGMTAARLRPEAHMFYRRLPDDLVKPVRLPRFMFRGKLRDVCLIVGLATLASLVGMLMPLATAMVMDMAIPEANTRLLLELGLGLIAAAFGAALFELVQGFVGIRMAIGSDAAAQPAIWDRLLNLRVSFFSRFSTGDLLSRVTAVSEVNRGLSGATVQSLLAALMSLLNLGLLAFFSMRLAAMAVGLAAVVALVTIVGGYYIHRYSRALLELRGDFFGLVVQMVNSVGKIRVAGAQQRAFTTWVNRYSKQLQLIRKAQAVEDWVLVFNNAVPSISAVLLFWIGVELLTGQGDVGGFPAMSIGIFLGFNTAMGTFLRGTTALSITAVELLETAAQGKRIGAILEAEQEVDESKVDPGTLTGRVSLSRVDFQYVEGGRKILDDVSLRAEPGEFIALVGPSGGGKSTVFRLVLGFAAPHSGTVAFDDKDLQSMSTTAVRRQLGVVLQSGRINTGSVLENIRAGAQISLDDAWRVAEDVGLAEDLRAMPMGLHTVISEGGGNLSGGQRQRLLIARALVNQPKILLLDEATSALDNKTQAIVGESLKRRNVTRIVIAHRLSTIRHADRIYVLDHGRVVEEGTYEELVSRDGLFAAMTARQLA